MSSAEGTFLKQLEDSQQIYQQHDQRDKSYFGNITLWGLTHVSNRLHLLHYLPPPTPPPRR